MTKKEKSESISIDCVSRRTFLTECAVLGMGITALCYTAHIQQLFAKNRENLHRAMYWKKLSGKQTKCLLCPNECILSPGENGLCHSRGNRGGVLYSLVYAQPCIIALDEIEKSPMYHYQTGSKVFSIATAGCNLSCLFCQNWEYSQHGPDKAPKKFFLKPKEVIKRAKKHRVKAINFFYTEPTIYYEYMLDTAKLAKKANMKTFCITAGYINKKPLEELIPYIDAFVVGLKGFTENFYSKYIGVNLEPVKKTLQTLAMNKNKTWFEIVNLIIPGLNDSEKSLRSMTKWIANNIGKEVPLHFTRFEPYYKLKKITPTPISTLKKAYKIARESKLQYVYLGNVPGADTANTFCPKCGLKVIERLNFQVIKNNLKKSRCSCGFEIPGHWL